MVVGEWEMTIREWELCGDTTNRVVNTGTVSYRHTASKSYRKPHLKVWKTVATDV